VSWDKSSRPENYPTSAQLEEFEFKKDESKAFLYECAVALFRESSSP
jgi:hypothetical protein